MIWMGFQRRAAYLPLTSAVRQTLVRHLLVAREPCIMKAERVTLQRQAHNALARDFAPGRLAQP
jgi:hypothetical protein